MRQAPMDTMIFLFHRPDPFFDRMNSDLPATGRTGGVGGAADLLGRGENSWDPLEDCNDADRIADPAFRIQRLYQSFSARRHAQRELLRVFGPIK